ncbi:NUDIX domain-containing protein [Candidatus Woesearchaeota archaeon]|nr:NUDIX domain-containing protein [Candidatus Woesearchaeota archaeon]
MLKMMDDRPEDVPHLNDPGIDFTVEVFPVHDNRVLLRKHDKYGIWLGVGGHIERHEDPIDAAMREPGEEVGLEVIIIGTEKVLRDGRPGEDYHELPLPLGLNRHRISPTHEHVTLAYAGIAKTDMLVPSEEEKSPEMRLMTEAEVLAHPEIKQSVKRYAMKALKIAQEYLSQT